MGLMAAKMGRSRPACPCLILAKPSKKVRAVRTRTGPSSISGSALRRSLCMQQQVSLSAQHPVLTPKLPDANIATSMRLTPHLIVTILAGGAILSY